MHDKKIVRRRRAVLAVLVVLSLILLTAYFGESAGGGLHSIQRGVVAVVSPIQDGASKALTPVRDLFGWIGDAFTAAGQRNKLRKEVAALERQNATLVSQSRQYTELAGILRVDQNAGVSPTHAVTTRVIAVSPTLWYENVMISAGSGAGVQVDDPVVNGAALIGKVTTVTGSSAIVTLITDSTSGVSARDAVSGPLGIIQPAVGDPSDLLMQDVADPSSVHTGDLIVTSGTVSGKLDSLFPPNIPIGRVTSVNPGDIYEAIHVTPLANLRQLDAVQVLTGGQRAGAGTLASVNGP